jgi:flagellar motor protein MotB
VRSLLKPRIVRVDEDNPYWISFSDLMSALLVIFILAAVALIIELTEKQKKIEKNIDQLQFAIQARKDILHEIKAELAKRKIVVDVADNDSVLRIPETTLTFASNSYAIPASDKTRDMVKLIGLTLHRAINKPFDKKINNNMRYEYLDTVFIEGHTDSLPTKKIKGNWGLSSLRAISLWELWRNNLTVSPSFEEMINASNQKIFSVSGYASSRRLELDDNTPEKRAANRRIDIRFTVKKPRLSRLEEIINQPNIENLSKINKRSKIDKLFSELEELNTQ